MSAPIQLLSTDFDGTLYAEFENPPIPARLQALIGQLQGQGTKWAINTGRDMDSLMETLNRLRLDVEPDYLVLVEREVHEHRNARYMGLESWNSACTTAHAELFARLQPELPRLSAWIKARFQTQIYEDPYSPFCLIAASNREMDVIHRYLDDFARSIPHLTLVRNDVYARFSHRAFNKGTALGELSRRLGLRAEAVFAAGDHLNDLPMLARAYAHFLAAPANAVPEVKETVLRQGGYVSGLSYGHGIAEALAYHLGQAQS